MVRAKFTVTEIRQHRHPTARTVVLQAEYDATIEEDRRFAQATPTGRLEMFVDNPAALAQLPIGSVHYLDFSPA
jgi:hypothetical protein